MRRVSVSDPRSSFSVILRELHAHAFPLYTHADCQLSPFSNQIESETFDLAGHSSSTIQKQFRDALSEPLPLSEMIRLTFITGAGKLGRQKYDEGAARAITSTLRDVGYEEDRGASAVLECAGTFKMQHDTGKNLKTVVVFPKVTGVGEGELAGGPKGSLIPVGTPEHRLAHSSINVFQANIESKCQTWSQKKGCAVALEALKEIVQPLDNKLMTGTPLTEIEQECYDSVSLASLEEKLAHVKKLMHKQVDNGLVTAQERTTFLHQVGERLQTLTTDIAEAEKQGKMKRVENLTAAKAKTQERKAMLTNISPKPAPPLKNEQQINTLRQELSPIEEIEDSSKGRLLTLKESQAIGRKEEILQQIMEQEVR
jgi:hypothetical protein